VRHTEVLERVKVEKSIPHTVQRRKANWIGHVLRTNCRLEHVRCENIARRTEAMKDEKEDIANVWP
jgi:hypothetical protein